MVDGFAVMESSAWSAAKNCCGESYEAAGSARCADRTAQRSVPALHYCEAMLEINWPVPTEQDSELRKSASAIEVWAAPLDLSSEQLSQCIGVLLNSERERAARFHFEKHRRRFQAARAFLRTALSRWLDVEPDEIEFAYGPNGKPALAGRFADFGVDFNLAHCDELAVLALTRLGAVGIDVERVRALADADELVARFFSPRENREFQKLPQSEKPGAFFNLWTRKEAWLKATGEGIGHLLNQVEVSFLPGEPAELLRLPGGWQRDNAWSMHQLTPAKEFTAALAITSTAPEIHCRRWPDYEP